MALPLAILLASLMSFGNLGERMELTAMKAAGISLFRIMSSLLVFIFLISLGAFFFSNNVLPVTQKKLWSLIFSLRQTSPELQIPEGEFYTGITGYNIYVKRKDPERKLLKDIMIYDFSKGFNNASVTLADSAKLKLSADKTFLLLSLYNGESFENLQRVTDNTSQGSIPYRRETFGFKEVIIDFNANFARMDADLLKDQYMSKNLQQLNHSIDSLSRNVKNIKNATSSRFVNKHFFERNIVEKKPLLPAKAKNPPSADTLFYKMKQKDMESAVNYALEQIKQTNAELDINKSSIDDEEYYLIRHMIEWHRKFTLSFACIIFFFIGAPLGAIIRKGGLGMPIVISVLMFIVYYIVDFSGYKLARENVWPVWRGMWLSSFFLLPIGIFLTYKAAVDSPIFNKETYFVFIKKIVSIFKRK
jgi:lipopolysaccharide export system permease protein